MSSENLIECPSAETLESLSAGRLTEDETAQTEAHLTSCDECCRRLEAIGASFLTEILPDEAAGWSGLKNAEDPPPLRRAMEALQTDGGGPVIVPTASENDLKSWLGQDPESDGDLGQLGTYQVREEVARGGMGIVLKGFDPDLQRTVAIKVLAPALASIPKFREAFLSEARAAARLQHENVMPIYAVEQHGELPYLVMPFVEGSNLQDFLDTEGALGLDETVRIGHQICRALEAAHREGLVHGDVKPGNVMLLEGEGEGDGRVWLADFGLARVVDDPDSRSLTGGSGTTAGTPGFMAPEQFAGEAGDRRSDLFAFGCVLSSMRNGGRSPFHAETTKETSQRVREEDPPSTKTAMPGGPDWLDHLISSLLEKDPQARPESAGVVREVLESHLPENRPGSRRAILIAACVLAMAALIGALILKSAFQDQPEVLAEGYLLGAGKDAPLFATLGEAIEAAESGGTITVRKTGELELDSLSIPAGKALTIRAAAGYHPIFLSRSWKTRMLETDSPLCLEGLEFRHPFVGTPGELAPILHCRKGEVFLANCRFVRSTAPLSQLNRVQKTRPLVRFDDCLHVEISGCEFYTRAGTNVAINVTSPGREASFHAVNNLLVGHSGLRLDALGTSSHSWRLERNTVAAPIPLSIRSRGAKLVSTRIEADRNLFDILNTFLELRNPGRVRAIDQAVKRTVITGDGNLYLRTGRPEQEREPIYVALAGPDGASAPIERIDSFDAFTTAFGPTGGEVQDPVFDWDLIEEYRNEFALMNAKLFDPGERLAEPGNEAGFDRALLGPGEAYDRWLDSESYAAWRGRIDDTLR